MNRKRSVQVGLLFNAVVLLLLTSGVLNQSREARYAYFFNASNYIKVEIGTQRTVAHGSLYDYKELDALLPQSARQGGAAGLAHYDPNTARMYFIAVDPETYTDAKWQERALIVQLPDFKLVGKIDFERYTETGVSTLLTPDGKRLYVGYGVSHDDRDNYVLVREVYDTRNFKLLETEQAVIPWNQPIADTRRDLKFSRKARFSDDGRTILDEEETGSVIVQAFGGEEYVITGKQVRKRQKPDWPIAVKEYQIKNPGFSPVWSSVSPARVLLLDVKYHEEIARIRDYQTGEYRVSKINGAPFTTGQLAYYDATAGGKLREFTIKELAGDHPRVPCVTPDGRTAYMAKTNDQKDQELYATDLLSGKAVKIELFDVPPVKCIFSDR
jgi:hypothetical protein